MALPKPKKPGFRVLDPSQVLLALKWFFKRVSFSIFLLVYAVSIQIPRSINSFDHGGFHMFALLFQYLLLNIVKATNQTIDIMDVYLQVNLLFFLNESHFVQLTFKKIPNNINYAIQGLI